MSEQRLWYLFSYDVREDKRLRRVAKHLEGYGARVQYSVFRCRLTRRGMERLRWELTKMMEPDDDLLIIGLCAACAERVRRRGTDEKWSEKVTTFEVV